MMIDSIFTIHKQLSKAYDDGYIDIISSSKRCHTFGDQGI